MNKTSFEKGIQNLKHLRMTSAEKSSVLARVFTAPIASPYASQKSWVRITQFTRLQYALAGGIALVLLASGSGLAYAAQGALPGDLLYPIKVHVTEPIQSLLATTPAAKAALDATLASKRLDEAQKLSKQNKLTPQYARDLSESIKKDAADFEKNIAAAGTSTDGLAHLHDSFTATVHSYASVAKELGLTDKKDLENESSTTKDPNVNINEVETPTSSYQFDDTNTSRVNNEDETENVSTHTGAWHTDDENSDR